MNQGVDIQKIRPVDAEALGKKMFTTAEQQMGDDFFTLWVKKESMLKKMGVGIKGRRYETGDHHFILLPDFSGYAAAVCTDCDGYELIEK